MSNLDHPGLPDGKEKITAIKNYIASQKSKIANFDYTQLNDLRSRINPEDLLALGKDIYEYINPENLENSVRILNVISLRLFTQLEEYIIANEDALDEQSIGELSKGMRSDLFDFRLYASFPAANKVGIAEEKGITLQAAPDLQDSVMGATIDLINLPALMADIKGDPNQLRVLKAELMKSSGGMEFDVDVMIQGYRAFKSEILPINSSMNMSAITKTFVIYFTALKLIAQALTNQIVHDLYQNIIIIFANYFNAISMGYDFSEEA